jgi:serine/threonine protein kinase
MELLEGEHLGALLGRAQDHPLPQTYAWSIVGAMGAALAHAHSRNVVHGDVSPKNVMITRDGEVRVLDFGSSSLGQGLAAAATAMADSFAATPAYASCEVLEGQKPEPRDDLYALACLAYELLAGEHPFRGKRSTEARDLGRTPRRPPGVNFMRWRTLQRGLAWTRAERSMSVREWLGNLGLEPQPERLPTLLPDSEPPPFYRVPLARGMALGIAVLAGAAVAWYSYTNSPEAISPGAVSPDLAVPTGSLPVTAGTAPPRVHDVSARYIAKPEALPREAVPPDALSLAAASPMAASPMAASPMVASPMAASPEAAQSQFTPPLIASSEAAPRDRVQLPAAARQATPTQAALRETQLQIAPPLASPPLASPPLASPPLASPPLASAAPPMVAASEAAPRDAVQLPDAARQATSTPAALREPQLQIAPLVAAERGPAPAQAAPRGTAPPQPAQAAPQGTAPPQPAQAAPQGTAPPQPAQAAPRGAAPPQPATAQASGSMATPLVASQEAAPRKSAPRRATLTARAAARSRNARARSMTASAHSMNPKARAMIAKARSKAPKARSTIQFTDHRYAVPPSARFVETHVRRSRASGDSTKFVWWTDDSTAKSGVDFVAQTPTPYVFSSGRQFASLFIRLVPNPARTQEANFHVCLGKPGSGSALTDVTCSAILLPAADTDPPS